MSSEDTVVVETLNGSLRGKKNLSVCGTPYYSFQGVPYGKAPVGDLRFKAPVPAEPWKGVRNALTEGSTAPSIDFLTREYGTNCSEDCLYLNVYTPRIPQVENGPPMAVMFWIHGGGFSAGSGNTDIYGPDYLVERNVVLVTCNYRLGVLGFLSTQSSNCPGNNGLKDMILALKWCQSNIATFGGDADNVTIFGESAGGAAVHYLTLSERAQGLFHRAVAQSGVALNPWALARKPRESAFRLGEALGLKTDDDRELLTFLKTIKPEDLVKSGSKILKAVDGNEHFAENAFVPCIEPTSEEAIISKHPAELCKNPQVTPVPLLLGSNTLEGLIMLKRGHPMSDFNLDTDLKKLIPSNLGLDPGTKEGTAVVERIRHFYFPAGFQENNFVKVLSHIYFLNGISNVIKGRGDGSGDVPTFSYRFSYNGNSYCLKHFLGFGEWKGTCHGDELSYLFKSNLMPTSLSKDTKDFEMMETLTKLWTDFAKSGRPMVGNVWTPISKGNFPYMDIDENLELKKDFKNEHLEFWEGIEAIPGGNQQNCKF